METDQVTGMAMDYTTGTMYGLTLSGKLVTIDLDNGAVTEIAATSERCACLRRGRFLPRKALPYGEYVVEQTKGWDGRELMSAFTVQISEHEKTYQYLINNAEFKAYLKIVKVDAETGKTSHTPVRPLRSTIRTASWWR